MEHTPNNVEAATPMELGDQLVDNRENGGDQSQVSGRQTRSMTEELRKSEMSLADRMMTEYEAISQAYKDCRERVKRETSLKKGGEITVVNECFKAAAKEADKAWASVVSVVTTALEASSNVKETEFLENMGLNSLDEAEKVMRENREELNQLKELLENVKALENVKDIPELLLKMTAERDEFERNQSQWKEANAEWHELKEMVVLKENESVADHWKAMNTEFQRVRAQLEQLRRQLETEEGNSKGLVESVDGLEKQVDSLIKDKERMKRQLDEQLARLVAAEDNNAGQSNNNNSGNRTGQGSQHGIGGNQDQMSDVRRQIETVQRMRMTREPGGGSSTVQGSPVPPATRGVATTTTLTIGAPFDSVGYQNGDAGASGSRYDGTTGSVTSTTGLPQGIDGTDGSGARNSGEAVFGKSLGLLGNALPRLSRYSGRKEDWEDFETGFMIRYGKMDTAVAMSLLKDNLSGAAKDALRSVPVEEKAKGVKRVLEWLRARLSNETPFEEIELDKLLRHQKIDGKSVGKVCEDLEEWTAKLHPEEDKKESIRRRQLLILYEGKYTEYVRLLTLFREGVSYSMMKLALVELEYMRRSEKEVKGYTKGNNGSKCFNCGGTGHKAFQCVSKNGNGGGSGGGGSFGNNGGSNGTSYRGGYSGPNRGGYSGGRGGNNYGGGQRFMQNNGYGNGGVRAHTGAAPANGYNNQRMYTNVGTGANSVPLGAKAGVNMLQGNEIRPSREMENMEIMGNEDREKSLTTEENEFFFIKRRKLVKGKLNGVPVEVLLDTGADVSIVSADVVDKIDGVVVEKGTKPVITDASNGVMDIIGRTVLEVELDVGKRTPVGFYVLNNGLGKVIIGGRGLDDVGVELREVGFREEEEQPKGNEVLVLRDATIEPGQLGAIWVSGSEHNAVMLESSIEQLVEGIAVTERIVNVPVFNNTGSVLRFMKHQPVGVWRVIDGAVEEMCTDMKDMRILADNRSRDVVWKEIKGKLVANRGQELENSLERVLEGNVDAFAKGEEDIGRLSNWNCSIDVMDGKPIRQKPRPIPFAIREKLRALVDRMMRQGVVKKSQSPWSSPIVVVKKKDGSLRLCIDYRKVNQMIRLDAQPLPHLESTIQSLSGKKYFSTIDLQAGFWQVGLAEGSRELTAFNLLGEHFEFQVLPFGLNVSPCQFQRAMMEMLKEEIEKEGKDKKVFCYIDDILVATETEDDHLKVLEWVLKRIIERRVKVNPNKCRFMMRSVEYLGHFVSDKGVSMEERKIVAVKEYPRPKNSSEVRSFVGLASYYRRFVKGFAKIAEPLHERTKKEVEWKWGLEEEKAFNNLKDAITKAPVLMQPNCEAAMAGEKPFLITTDASGHGIGGVLSQANEYGAEKPVAYYSRSLKGPEKNYSIIDLEALAIFEAVRKWKYLIFGTKTIVRTDHSPLTSMFKRQNVCPRILRWATELLPYNLEIIHVKGKENVVADSLSRFPVDSNDAEPVTIGEDIVINAMTRMQLNAEKQKLNNEGVSREMEEGILKWRTAQGDDEWVQEMIQKKRELGEEKGDISEMIRMPDSTKKFTLADIEVDNGILYMLDRDHERRLYVPVKERKRLITEVHESVLVGHQGGKKMHQLLRKEYIWGAMEKDIADVLRACDLCLKSKPRRKFVPELQPREAKAPLEIVAVDLIDMGKGMHGNRYILTVIDLFTRYAGAYPLKDKKATTVAREFLNRWILEGPRVPKALLSDNGGEFINEVFEEINKMWKIERKCTLPYHSRANGGVERLNRTINETLRRLVGKTDEWEDALPYALYCYNTVPHSATGESPSFLFHGRDDGLPVGEPWKVNEKYVVDLEDYKSRMMLLMRKTQEEVNERLKGEREKMKASYDRKWENNKKHEPIVGDRVYVLKEKGDEQNPKLRIKWEGPFRVVKRSNTTATIVGIESGMERVVQLDRLRKVPMMEKEDSMLSINELSYCSRLVGRESPMHWENACPECTEKPRMMKEVWRACPTEFAAFSFKTLKEYAIMRTLVEKFPSMTPVRAQKLLSMGTLSEEEEIADKTIEETVGNMCQHAMRCLAGNTAEWRFEILDINPRFEEAYRRGLGEDVDTSLGYGAVVHQPGIAVTRRGGDKARWEWRVEMHSEWNSIFTGWNRLNTKKTIKSLLIFWPRVLSMEDMTALKDLVVYHTEKNAWEVVIVMEPSGGPTQESYLPFLIEWSAERCKTGRIRVIVTDTAICDGTPIPALERCHSWIRRDHWEYAVQAWVRGNPWDPKMAEMELESKGFVSAGEVKKPDEVREEVYPKLKQVLVNKRKREAEEIICFVCGGTGHKGWKCATNEKNLKKKYNGRGRPWREEEDEEGGPSYKRKKKL